MNAMRAGRAGSRSAAAQPSAARASLTSASVTSVTYGSTLVSVARRVPSGVRVTVTGTVPARVANTRSPGPMRSARATAVATVAWPQNGTSARGLKYRTVWARPGSPRSSGGAVRNAVSL